MFEKRIIDKDYPNLQRLKKYNLIKIEDEKLVNRLYDDYYSDTGFFDYLYKANTDNMSTREKQAFYNSWVRNFKPCTLATDYLTSCKGNTDDVICYDDESLKRLYHDPCLRKVKKKGKDKRHKDYVPEPDDLEMGEYECRAREHSVSSVSRFSSNNADNSIGDYSDYEYAEYKSYKNGYREYELSTEDNAISNIERERLISIFEDETEKQIAELLIKGKTQKYIYEKLSITKSKLDTILHGHMKKSVLKCYFGQIPSSLENEIAKMVFEGYSHKEITDTLCAVGNEVTPLSLETKVCKRCSKELSIDLFGNDSRKKDGKQSICKSCDNKRKSKAYNT